MTVFFPPQTYRVFFKEGIYFSICLIFLFADFCQTEMSRTNFRIKRKGFSRPQKYSKTPRDGLDAGWTSHKILSYAICCDLHGLTAEQVTKCFCEIIKLHCVDYILSCSISVCYIIALFRTSLYKCAYSFWGVSIFVNLFEVWISEAKMMHFNFSVMYILLSCTWHWPSVGHSMDDLFPTVLRTICRTQTEIITNSSENIIIGQTKHFYVTSASLSAVIFFSRREHQLGH